jgi:hypothetical protein
MTPPDPKILAALVLRAHAIVHRLRQIATFEQAETLCAELLELETAVAVTADHLQALEFTRRGPSTRPRPDASRLSSDLAHGVRVQRFTAAGSPALEQPRRTDLSGIWKNTRWKRPA